MIALLSSSGDPVTRRGMTNSQSNHRALVVDCDAARRKREVETLEQAGFVVVEADNGKLAVTLLDRVKPELILLDVDTPGMNGFDACRSIRAKVEFSDTPIILITDQKDAKSIDKAYKSGATDCVSKPINWSLVNHRLGYIRRTLQVSQGLRESEARNRAFIQAIPDAILVIDKNGRAVEQVGGFDKKRISLDKMPDRLLATWQRQVQNVIQTGEVQTSEFGKGDGAARNFFEVRMVPFTGDRALMIIRDISAQKRTNAKVYRLAFYDTLTGLPNRDR